MSTLFYLNQGGMKLSPSEYEELELLDIEELMQRQSDYYNAQNREMIKSKRK